MQTIKEVNSSTEDKIVNKINELYITNRKKYLVLSNKKTTGKYYLIDEGKERFVPLNDSLIRRHLQSKQTIGVFAGKNISKFLCFDLDILDKSKLKWTYYLLVQSLNELGISNEHIQVATSGNKGYHVLIFIKDGTSLSHLISLFNLAMNQIKCKLANNIPFTAYSSNEHYGEFDFGKIEMRPTSSQGVKIELGINFFNTNIKTNKCVFLNNETLEPIENDEYILSVNGMNKEDFVAIMENINDKESYIEKIIVAEKESIKSSLQEPHSHKVNKDENVTIEHVVNLINNGLYLTGTRHNSCLKIAKYFRYIGLEVEESILQLQSWMKSQNTKYYSSPLAEALLECERICKVVYEKEYQLFGNVKNITLHKGELSEIIKIENKYDKLLLHTMLIHSKRYSLKNGVFYITYKQMEEMSGVGIKGSMASINRLEDMGYIKVVSRSIRQENSYKHLPNRYMITLNAESVNTEVILEIDNASTTINNELYYKSIIKAFNNEELSHLPARQYKELRKYRKSMVG